MKSGITQSLRWGLYFTLALGLHGAAAAAFYARWSEQADVAATSTVVMIDLAPVAVAPSVTPTEMPPDKVDSKQIDPEPEPQVEEKPIEKVELPPDPVPQPELAATPPKPKPVEKKVKKQPKKQAVARATANADNKSEQAAAPMPGAAARDSNALPTWKSRLIAQIERNKRYPSEAQSRREEGIAYVAFSIDRSGSVHNARVVRSSGSRILDQDAISWLQRAQPLPPPPPEVPGSQIALSVPMRYNLR